jgi:hypothetical protein
MRVLIANVAVTWALVGLIWTIQLVHYKLFDSVGESAWLEYHRRHTANITLLVGPLMLAELLTAAWLIWHRPAGVPGWAVWVGLGLVIAMWLSTAFIQVPLHNRLSAGLDAAVAGRLVATNWIRTIGWTLRGGLVAWMLWRASV